MLVSMYLVNAECSRLKLMKFLPRQQSQVHNMGLHGSQLVGAEELHRGRRFILRNVSVFACILLGRHRFVRIFFKRMDGRWIRKIHSKKQLQNRRCQMGSLRQNAGSPLSEVSKLKKRFGGSSRLGFRWPTTVVMHPIHRQFKQCSRKFVKLMARSRELFRGLVLLIVHALSRSRGYRLKELLKRSSMQPLPSSMQHVLIR